MVGLREEVELSGIVGSFLRHASCRFNRDAPDLRPRPGAGRPRKVDPQLAQPAEIERRADLGRLSELRVNFPRPTGTRPGPQVRRITIETT